LVDYVLFRPFFASSRSLPRGDPLEKDNPVRSGSVNPGFSILEKVIIKPLRSGLEKTRVVFKKPSPVCFFGLFGGFFGDFFGFFLYICPEERVFRVFQFQEYF
jgi:hypothetical protein